MEALHHRAFLRGHEPAGLRADDPECVLETRRVQRQHTRCRRRRGEGAGCALRMKAAKEEAHRSRVTHARADFVTRYHRGDHVANAGAARLRECEGDRRRERTHVNDGFLVNVVQLEGMAARSIHECCERHRCLVAHADEGGCGPRAFRQGEIGELLRPRQRCTEKRAADAVEYAQLDAFDHVLRQVFVRKRRSEAGEIARGVLENGC